MTIEHVGVTKMNVLILEDEASASKRLKTMLGKIIPDITILAVIDSVEDAVAWLHAHDEPDIIFADIQLSDGICFDIFRQVKLMCPVVFTTAYDEYAVEAFKVNSIDYLLKPIHADKLKSSIDKLDSMKLAFGPHQPEKLDSLMKLLDRGEKGYKTRFLVYSGQTMKSVPAESAAYFMIDNQLVFLVNRENKRYLIEYTLDDLEVLLDPSMFFRINRQMIVSLEAVTAIHPYFNNRLKLDIEPGIDGDIFVSRKRVGDFKKWLDR
jgi:DNA-binding LytR/AlgR family response regulator